MRTGRQNGVSGTGLRRGLARTLGIAVAVAVSASGLQAIAPVAAANAAASGSQADVSEAPNTASAMKAARAAGHRVLDLSQSTETSKAWINPDGSTSLSSYSAPVQARTAGGGWAPIDTTLVTDAAGVHPKAVTDPVTLGNGSSASLLSVPGVKGFGLDWLAKLPAPTTSGDTATYANVLPGADLTVTAQPSGFEFSLVLDALPAKPLPATVSLPVKGDLTATVTAGGGLQLTDRSGTVVASGPAPVVHDAVDPATGEPYHTQPLPMSVTGSPGAQKLVLTMPTAFLADPTTVYPVVVDPTVSFSEYDSTYVYTLNGVSQPNPGNTAHLHMGYKSSNLEKSRTLLQYTLSSLSGKHILSASLSAYNELSLNCTATTTQLFPITSAYTMNTVTWATMPTLGTQAGSATFAYGASGCAHNWVTFSGSGMTTMVQNWANGTVGMNGVLLKATTETDGNSYRQWASRYGGGGEPTRIDVTYNSYPGTTAGRYMTPYNKDASGAWWTRSTTPALKGTGPDADGGTSRLHGEIWNTAHTTRYFVGDGNSTPVLTTSTLNDTYPLSDGTKYSWHAQMFDGIDYSQAWSSWIDFTVDTTAPSAPAVSSTSYPANSWNPAGGAGTFTFGSTDSGSGVAYYLYGLDTPTPASATASGVASVTLTPPLGWHTLYVRAVDIAGNLSAVSSWAFGAGAAQVLTPAAGAVTNASVDLVGTAPTGASQVTFYYRRADTDPWTPVSTADVTGSGFSGWPYTFTAFTGNGESSPALAWSVKNTVNGVDGPVQVADCFGTLTSCPTSPGASLPSGASSPVSVTLDQNSLNVAATQDVGAGTVNLVTGNAEFSATDASVPGASNTSLSVGRTLNARTAATTGGIFGAGWTAALPVDSAGSDWTGLTDFGSLLNATGSDQSSTSFALTSAGSYAPTGEDADSGLSITVDTTHCDSGFRCYQLSDLDGNKTVFESATGNPAPGAGSLSSPVSYQVNLVIEPGSTSSTTFSYSSGKVTDVLSPVPSSGTCTDPASASTWSPGCRSLHLSYTSDAHLSAVTYRSSDGTNPLQVDVACYSYTGTGSTAQLSTEWDPRDIASPNGSGTHPIVCDPANPVRPTSYSYDSAARLTSITPAGLAASTFTYDSPSSAGRLTQVSRTSGSSTLTTKVLYGVPLSLNGSTSYRPDLTSTSQWAQTDTPDPTVGGTAICQPGASVTDSNGDLRDCTISYVDANGRLVNSASYAGSGDAGWHLSTSQYDASGHLTSSLSPANREEALSPTSGAGLALNLPTDTAAAAQDLSSINLYTPSSLDGQPDLTDSYGPYHWVQLANGTRVAARAHTHIVYDDGTEPGHPQDAFNQPTALHLVRKVITGASQSPEAVTTAETDERETDTTYWLGTDYTGWTYRQPMQTITDPAGLAITNTTLYDATTGSPVESRMPSNTAGGGVGTTLTRYYTADASSPDSGCRNKPLWAGLVCKTLPAADARVAGVLPSLVTTTTAGYDYLNRATSTQESVTDAAGTTVTRTTASSYGFNSSANPYAGTLYGSTVTGATGAPVPTRTYSYDGSTGLPTGVAAAATADSANTATGTATTYDGFGRTVTFTDDTAAGTGQTNTTTNSYDPTSGRPTQTADTHTTTSYTYNGGGEHRGLPTAVSVSVNDTSAYTGTFTGNYDANGSLTSQTDPNGITSTLTRDENGQLVGLTDKVASSGADWASDSAVPSIHGQWLHHVNNVGVHDYSYDSIGRLTQAADTPDGGSCTIRSYDFTSAAMGADSNRLASTSYPSLASNGSCQTTSPYSGGTPTSHSYDTADRLTDTGVGYDAFGRITSLPAADAGGATLSSAYYINDLVRSQTQNGTSQCWTLDADQQLKRSTSYTSPTCSGTVTADRTNHYDDPGSDSPAWIAEQADGTTWTANISGLVGGLGLTVNQIGTVTYQYTDLHGDVLATATATATAPTFTPDYDEFGNAGTASNTRYGWLGGEQRSADAYGGTIFMGVRMYSPVLGRFLQVDPVSGGSANSYDYVSQDPINLIDLDGRRQAPEGSRCTCTRSNSKWHPVGSWFTVDQSKWMPQFGNHGNNIFKHIQDFFAPPLQWEFFYKLRWRMRYWERCSAGKVEYYWEEVIQEKQRMTASNWFTTWHTFDTGWLYIGTVFGPPRN
jgi:RHS repeat-associated protein